MVDIARITSGLTRDDDGIWIAAQTSDVSYPADGHATCRQVEERSFWFRHRNACIAAAVRRHPPVGDGPILDVGGGNGFVSVGLADAGFEVVLVEPGREGAANARARGVEHVVCATTDSARFSASSVPAVGLFDVIEHIEDDAAFLTSMRDLLAPGGRLYATVPAYRQLWSAADVDAGHHRRYTRDEISAVLMQSGFSIDYASYIFRPLPVPVLLFRALPHRIGRRTDASTTSGERTGRSHATGGGLLSKGVLAVLGPEVDNIERGVSMRFGGSILVVARKGH